MNQLNSILCEGVLTADPESTKTAGGTPLTTFTIETHRFFKVDGERRKEVLFVDIEVEGRLAETCHEYLTEGRSIRVVGRLAQKTLRAESGEPSLHTFIAGEHVEIKPIKTAVELPQPKEEVVA